MILDPQVLLDFAMEDLLEVAHAVARQIFAFRHHAHAYHVAVLRNVPEPAFFRDERDGGRAGVNAFVAPGATVISPDGDLVEFGIFDPPGVSHRDKRFFARAVECHRRTVFDDFAMLVLDTDT